MSVCVCVSVRVCACNIDLGQFYNNYDARFTTIYYIIFYFC